MVDIAGHRRILSGRPLAVSPLSRRASHPEGVTTMVTSIILMNVERALVNDVAERIADRPEVSEVYSVSGTYDLVAIVRVPQQRRPGDAGHGAPHPGRRHHPHRNHARLSRLLAARPGGDVRDRGVKRAGATGESSSRSDTHRPAFLTGSRRRARTCPHRAGSRSPRRLLRSGRAGRATGRSSERAPRRDLPRLPP